jgi:TolB protein
LVYVSEVADKDEELYLTAYPITGEPQRLTKSPQPDYDPAWAVDGQSLFFTSERDGNGEIYRLYLAEKRLERLTQHVGRDSHPAPSPDGKQLVFVSDRDGDPELYHLTLATGALRRLTTHPGVDMEPLWEGPATLLYASQQGNDTQIMRLDLKTGVTTPLTELGTGARQPRLWR